MRRKRFKKKQEIARLREELRKEQDYLDSIHLPDKNITKQDFLDFVVAEFLKTLSTEQKTEIIENSGPTSCDFTLKWYIMNAYIANYHMRGYNFIDVEPEWERTDHFREGFASEIADKIIETI